MNRASGLWHRLVRRIGFPGIAALLLLVLASLLAIWAFALERQTQKLRTAIGAQRAARPATTAAPLRQVPLAEQVDAFVGAFAPLDSSAADLEHVFLSAQQHHIELPKGEYKFKQGVNEPLASYTISFPVHADYGAIRDFSADVLRALPNASMEELRMSRSNADSSVLEAVVRFTLVYRR